MIGFPLSRRDGFIVCAAFEIMKPRLLQYLRRKGVPHHDREDILQEVQFRLWRHLGRSSCGHWLDQVGAGAAGHLGRHADDIERYIFVAVRNAFSHYLRQARRSIPMSADSPSERESQEEPLNFGEFVEGATLDETDRRIVELAQSQIDQKSIARELGIDESTVSRRIGRMVRLTLDWQVKDRRPSHGKSA